MTDRMIARAWWLATMLLIAFTASMAMFTAYRGVFDTFAGAYVEGAICLLGCFPLGAACFLLCRHRGDLVCD